MDFLMIVNNSEFAQEKQLTKIFQSFDILDEYLSKHRTNKKVVLCHGVFDLLHIGHIRHFHRARTHGDILVVSITPDHYVNKGPGRPAFTERLRAEAIASLECVDYVIINSWPTAVETIKRLRPHFYVKGDEYKAASNDVTGNILPEQMAVEAVGGELIFTSDITFSSSSLINQFFSSHSAEVSNFLSQFKHRYTSKIIFDYLDAVKSLKVLVVGEAIIDTYHFTDVIGKAGKEPILAAKHQAMENYLGGSLAVANHLSDFCGQVTCLTYLGEKKEHEGLIQAGLKSNIQLVPIYKENSPTIVKTRYVDNYLQQKLFELYEINDDFIEGEQEQALLDHLNYLITTHDLVIAIDYGHGLLTEASIRVLTEKSKFLAVNTQSNASNMGFNCISKYPKANYVAIANRELQLNYRQKHLPTNEQIVQLMTDHQYDKVMVTCGKNGAYVYYQNDNIVQAPAFTNHVVDRVGAGDAVLSITSLFAYQQAPAELLAFIGNIVGAEAVSIMGNKDSIKKISLMKHISHLLK